MNAEILFDRIFFEENDFSTKEISNMYKDLDWKEKIYFSYLCKKNLEDKYHISFESDFDCFSSCLLRYSQESKQSCKLSTEFFLKGDLKTLTDIEKENLCKMSTFCAKYDDYWVYNGYSNLLRDEIKRDFSIKIGIPAINKEDSEKIFDTIFPYLIENEEIICFKVPNLSRLDTHFKREVGGNLFTIYTRSDEQAFKIIKDLDDILDKANLDVFKKTNLAYVECGNSGLVSAIVDDRMYGGGYIPRENTPYDTSRNYREDNFEYLKNLLMSKGLIYGKSIEANDEKEKELKFGKYKNLRKNITQKDIDDFIKTDREDGTAYFLGAYNVSKDDLYKIFDKETGIVDDRAFNTLYSFGYNVLDIVDVLVNSKEDNCLSIFNCDKKINLVNSLLENKDKYFKVLEDLSNKNIFAFEDFTNSMLDYLKVESFKLRKDKDVKEFKDIEKLKNETFYFLINKEDLNKNFQLSSSVSLDIIKDNSQIASKLVKKNIISKDIGQELYERELFKNIKFEKTKEMEDTLKFIGLDIRIPENKDLVLRMKNLTRSFLKEDLISKTLSFNTRYYSLNKDTFEEKTSELIDMYIKELFDEKENDKLKRFDIDWAFKEDNPFYLKFVQKLIDTDIVEKKDVKISLEEFLYDFSRNSSKDSSKEISKDLIDFIKRNNISIDNKDYSLDIS